MPLVSVRVPHRERHDVTRSTSSRPLPWSVVDVQSRPASAAARPASSVVASVSSYHVHARLFEGTLADPVRNELQSAESNDREEVMTFAKELSARGFTVWVYEHAHGSGPNGHNAPYRLIATWGPDEEG